MFKKLSYKQVAVASSGTTLLALILATASSLRSFPDDFNDLLINTEKNVLVDRNGKSLNVTYENKWNSLHTVKIHDVPEFLKNAFVISEDKRFYTHNGMDWRARLSALKQNLLAGKTVRGASTITEQVVRMLHPRERTIWSRWIEGFEAIQLESSYSKLEILEFYLNQVPYKSNRRGIVQAAYYYFDRDINTLNQKEMLALSVMVRSPKWFDPIRYSDRLDRSISSLFARIMGKNITDKSKGNLNEQHLSIANTKTRFNAQHFVEYVNAQGSTYSHDDKKIHTTLDVEIQDKIQGIINNRLELLRKHNVKNGAVLAINHETNEVISWVVGYAGEEDKPFNKINAIVTPRQPGSTLKPLLYASAIRKGWTAATMIDDSPLEESVGSGMHSYSNYSRSFYGMVSVREALGNSLNIPAIKAIQYVGAEKFLSFLSDLGINSLTGHPNVYGDGIALGNGELTLYELVQAYTVLARMGSFKPISFIEGEHLVNKNKQIVSTEISSLVADIMSDPGAREKEFGWESVLNFPHQTAVKTGTSSDYRDAWAIGFDDKYTVGVWLGNLDYTEMDKVTGSTGPAIVLRTVFNELNRFREVRPLYFSNQLNKKRVCIETGMLENNACKARDEWFVSGTMPQQNNVQKNNVVRIRKPSKGLLMAMDPRIPDDHEYFEFKLTDNDNIKKVDWFVNNKLVATTSNNSFHWKVSKGKFTGSAKVWLKDNKEPVVTESVNYKVN